MPACFGCVCFVCVLVVCGFEALVLLLLFRFYMHIIVSYIDI